MSDLLALEWEHDQISGVLAHVTPGRVRVKRCFVLPRPQIAAAGSGALPVDWLKSQLALQGITGGDVLVALPRDEAVVKRIDLPETSDDELPVIVRFQAAAKSSVAIDELSLDFIPLPRRSEIPGREVLMATVAQQTIAEVRLLCEHAGLHLKSLGLTPAAVAEFVARVERPTDDAGGASLVAARHGNRLEISVLRRCHLLFSHAARLSSEEAGHDPQTIVSEVSRSLVSLRGAISDVKIDRAWTLLAPAEHTRIAEVLERRLSCEVQALDPFTAVECEPGRVEADLDKPLFAGPLGLLLARAEPRVPSLDFLAPRKPPVKRDTRKQRLAFVGAGVAVLIGLVIGNFWLQTSSLDSDINVLVNQARDLDNTYKRKQDILNSAKAIDEWSKDSVSWLDQLDELTQRLPTNDRIYVESIKLDPRVAKTPPRIRVKGFARERADIMGLDERFHTEDDRFRITAPDHRSSSDDSHFPWRFDSEIWITESPAKPPAKKESASPAGAKPDSGKSPPASPGAKSAAAQNDQLVPKGSAAS